MQSLSRVNALRSALSQHRNQGQRIALVPTMGNIHEGHLRLVDAALAEADLVVVSIYINPTQFNRSDDLAAYPRTLERDAQQLAERGVQLLFTPNDEEMYPGGVNMQSHVDVSGISEELEGASRPGHFRGVATVVSKLFNIVQPDAALFGEKDFQQLAVIRTMARELAFPITILSVPTVRAESGLALSSRNSRLNPAQLAQAPTLFSALKKIAVALQSNQRAFSSLCQIGAKELTRQGFSVEYLEIRSRELKPLSPQDSEAVILVAAWLDKVRLLDNLPVTLTA